jgi:hypothetical protein
MVEREAKKWGRNVVPFCIALTREDAAKVRWYAETTKSYPTKILRDLIQTLPEVPVEPTQPAGSETGHE